LWRLSLRAVLVSFSFRLSQCRCRRCILTIGYEIGKSSHIVISHGVYANAIGIYFIPFVFEVLKLFNRISGNLGSLKFISSFLSGILISRCRSNQFRLWGRIFPQVIFKKLWGTRLNRVIVLILCRVPVNFLCLILWFLSSDLLRFSRFRGLISFNFLCLLFFVKIIRLTNRNLGSINGHGTLAILFFFMMFVMMLLRFTWFSEV
jgi:hypothetical protein